jgi:hypothetical protein
MMTTHKLPYGGTSNRIGSAAAVWAGEGGGRLGPLNSTLDS